MSKGLEMRAQEFEEMDFSILIKQREKRKESLREKAPREAKELSSILTSHFPYEKLYLFSSVLKNQRFTPHSDLDLVIKGLDRSLFLKAYAFLLPTSLPAGKFFLVDFSIFHSHGSFSPFVPCPRIDLQ